MDTPCKNCVFAQYEGNTQKDCTLDLLAKYRANGVEVADCYDEEKEFFVLKNTLCPYYRDEKWADAKKKDWEGDFPNGPPVSLENEVYEEVQLRCDAFIHVSDKSTLEDIGKTFDSLIAQTRRPQKVILLVNSWLKPTEIIASIEAQEGKPKWEYNGLPYQICHIWERDAENKRIPTLKCLDTAFSQVGSPYFSVFEAGYEVPCTFFEDIHTAICVDMKQIVMLKPKAGNGFTIQSKAFKMVGGNSPVSIDDVKLDGVVAKIEMLAQQQGVNVIREVGEVCRLT